ELAAGEARVQHRRVHAGDPRFHPARDHVAGEVRGPARRAVEQRKQRHQAGAGEPLLAVFADVVEKQIAERRMREPFADRSRYGAGHRALVDVVGTRRRNRDQPQRRADRRRLRLEDVDAHCMHRRALRSFVDRRQQRSDFDAAALPEHVHRPCTVLARGPGDDRLHRNARGWSTAASFAVASPTRGPGTTNSSPCSRMTVWFLTAGTDASASQAFTSSRAAESPRAYRSSTITSGARASTSSVLIITDCCLTSASALTPPA